MKLFKGGVKKVLFTLARKIVRFARLNRDVVDACGNFCIGLKIAILVPQSTR